MKLLLLSGPDISHTYKWATALASRGFTVCLVGFSAVDPSLYKGEPNITVHSLGIEEKTVLAPEGSLRKLSYLSGLPRMKKIINTFQPDILHAHFATSYGLLGALSGFHPFVLSVWGNDVFTFPEKSPLHKALLKFNLSRADRVLSTSMVMARQASRFTGKPVGVTPFGVDLDCFRPEKKPSQSAEIVIGTVKTLEPIYGIEYLLQAFKIVANRNRDIPMRLLVVGGGSQRSRLRKLAATLGIERNTTFSGRIPYRDIARYHNMIDISVYTSVTDGESFCVSAVEAAACGNPVVASDVGGLPEVVENGVTGIIVPRCDAHRTADAIETLVLNPSLRKCMGAAGRQRAHTLFNWDDCVNRMMEVYESLLTAKKPCIPAAARITNESVTKIRKA